jgi:hypothetical protein
MVSIIVVSKIERKAGVKRKKESQKKNKKKKCFI